MFDPLHQESGPTTRWTTVNTAEALPGVPTPLGWTMWNHPLERAMRGAFSDIGCLPPSASTGGGAGRRPVLGHLLRPLHRQHRSDAGHG